MSHHRLVSVYVVAFFLTCSLSGCGGSKVEFVEDRDQGSESVAEQDAELQESESVTEELESGLEVETPSEEIEENLEEETAA